MAKTEAPPVPVEQDVWFWPDFCEDPADVCGGHVVARVRIDGVPVYVCQAHAEAPPYRHARRVDVDWLR